MKRERKKSQKKVGDGPSVSRPDDASTKTSSSSGTKSSSSGSRSHTSVSSSGKCTEIKTAGATITVVATDRKMSINNQPVTPTKPRPQETAKLPLQPNNRQQQQETPRTQSQGSVNSHKRGSQSGRPKTAVSGEQGSTGPRGQGDAYNVPPSRRRKNSYDNAMNEHTPVKIVPPTLKFLPPEAGASGPGSPTEASTVYDESSSSSEGVYEIEDIENVVNERRDQHNIAKQAQKSPVAMPTTQARQQVRQESSESETESEDEEETSEEYTDESESDDDDVRSMASIQPAIVPPKTTKAKLHATPEVFRELDEQAIEVSISPFSSRLYMNVILHGLHLYHNFYDFFRKQRETIGPSLT